MQHWYYLIALLIAIAGLLLADYRYEFAFWADAFRTAKVIAVMMGIFIVWDLLGIHFGIFFHGNSNYDLPIRLLPQFPLEELFFLFILSYISLLLNRARDIIWK